MLKISTKNRHASTRKEDTINTSGPNVIGYCLMKYTNYPEQYCILSIHGEFTLPGSPSEINFKHTYDGTWLKHTPKPTSH